jgi:hypothetical protein
MALILNPSIILSTVVAQTVNEFIPPGVVLISLMFFVVVSILINIYNGIKKYRLETQLLEKLKKAKELNKDIENSKLKISKVSQHLES